MTKLKEPYHEIILKRRTERGDPVIQPAYVSAAMYHHILGVIMDGNVPDGSNEVQALRKEVREMKLKLASVRRLVKGV